MIRIVENVDKVLAKARMLLITPNK
jgi:hypothetical protein